MNCSHSWKELPALIALCELRRQEGKPDESRTFLDDVWDRSEVSALPRRRVQSAGAQIERDAGNLDKAIAAAPKPIASRGATVRRSLIIGGLIAA